MDATAQGKNKRRSELETLIATQERTIDGYERVLVATENESVQRSIHAGIVASRKTIEGYKLQLNELATDAKPNKKLTALDCVKYDTPLSSAMVSRLLEILEHRRMTETQIAQGIGKILEAYKANPPSDRSNVTKARMKQFEATDKQRLIEVSLGKYKQVLGCQVLVPNGNSLVPQRARENRKVTGTVEISITAAKDLEHLLLPQNSSQKCETFIAIRKDTKDLGSTPSTLTDTWDFHLEADVTSAQELELVIYDNIPRSKLQSKTPVGLVWIRLADVVDEQRQIKNARIQGEMNRRGAAGNDPGEMARLNQTLKTEPIKDWFTVEPGGALELEINIVKTSNVIKKPYELERRGAVHKNRPPEDTLVVKNHRFVPVPYRLNSCSVCYGSLFRGDGMMCENCSYSCHRRCVPDVIFKCSSSAATNTNQEDPNDVEVKHEIHHLWETATNWYGQKCRHCGRMLPLGRVWKCNACNIRAHTECAELMPRTCGLDLKMVHKLKEIQSQNRRRSTISALPNVPKPVIDKPLPPTHPEPPVQLPVPVSTPVSSGPLTERQPIAPVPIPVPISTYTPLPVTSSMPHASRLQPTSGYYPPLSPPVDTQYPKKAQAHGVRTRPTHTGPQGVVPPGSQTAGSVPHSQTPRPSPKRLSAPLTNVVAAPPPRQLPILNDYDFIRVLGRGNFGKVLLSREKATGNLVAIKVLKKFDCVDKGEMESLHNEKSVFVAATQARHPFLLNLVSCFQDKENLFFVMEYISGGDLMLHVQKERFSRQRAKFYAAEVLLALEYFHSQGIIYRDLKLDNILLTTDGHVKVADYGLCKLNMWEDSTTKTFCGTPEFMAPEILLEEPYTRAVDWWTFGILLYEMILGQAPFRGEDEDEIFDAVLQDEPLFPAMSMPPHSVLLLKQLLERDPTKRLGCGPEGAKEIKRHPYFAGVDWDALYEKRIEPPFKPTLQSATDTSWFDEQFTSETVNLTPANSTVNPRDQEEFESFDYVRP